MATMTTTNSSSNSSTIANNIYLPPAKEVDETVDFSPWLAGRIVRGASPATLHLAGFPLGNETSLVLISRRGAYPIDWPRATSSEEAAESVNAHSALLGIVALSQGRRLELRAVESGANSVVEVDLVEGDLDVGLGAATGSDAVVQHDWEIALGT
ncbi:MAG: hypothetical protein ACI9HK_001319 [Pirellulaceae bacterium]|jgi:hypothetical protein